MPETVSSSSEQARSLVAKSTPDKGISDGDRCSAEQTVSELAALLSRYLLSREGRGRACRQTENEGMSLEYWKKGKAASAASRVGRGAYWRVEGTEPAGKEGSCLSAVGRCWKFFHWRHSFHRAH